MEPNELPGLSQFQEDLDGFSDRIFQSLDILARALHVKNAELEPALQAIVSTAVTTLSSAQHAGLITVSRGAMFRRPRPAGLSSSTSCSKSSMTGRASTPRSSRP